MQALHDVAGWPSVWCCRQGESLVKEIGARQASSSVHLEMVRRPIHATDALHAHPRML